MTTIERIKKISKERGWSLQKVAEKAGIGINSIYRWNTKTPSTASLQAVADVLDVSVDYLLGKDDDPSTANKRVDLDKALSEEGIAMFEGKPLSEEYKKALLAMLRANKNSGE
ncbi:helix-turn-helix transcriptional regulator [Pediococcus acidilactici]|uniref:helix-turn-helix domain-containing protein n=1 Tax=Pediococcus acidilactici TaxID=1254 RepID=UPI00232D1B17|nr:helix-turn-helix transcriptional regulator [Pediococcus acidilactici]MDB8868979.1 helix-turn-helix transcriptional regulator [Pediococcus acidilactici]